MRPMSNSYRTRPSDAVLASTGIVPFYDGHDITAEPLVDETTGLYARLTDEDARAVAASMGGRLLTLEEAKLLHEGGVGHLLAPVMLWRKGEPIDTIEKATEHDAKLREQLVKGWDGVTPLANAGKTWLHDAEPGTNHGWWLPEKKRYVQNPSPSGLDGNPSTKPPHNESHTDYSQLTMVVFESRALAGPTDPAPAPAPTEGAAEEAAAAPEPETELEPGPRPTLRVGARGGHVRALQAHLGAAVDGHFGSKTEAEVRRRQRAAGLVADGIVGERTWALFGEAWKPAPVATYPGDPRAPACVAAIRDANKAWPTRKRASDGIMGDAAHQARPSDHNLGNAVDITHDPRAGADGHKIATAAMIDDRVTYIIWDRRIWSRLRAAEGWRPYQGSNPHTHHVHISVAVEKRDEDHPWPWG